MRGYSREEVLAQGILPSWAGEEWKGAGVFHLGEHQLELSPSVKPPGFNIANTTREGICGHHIGICVGGGPCIPRC